MIKHYMFRLLELTDQFVGPPGLDFLNWPAADHLVFAHFAGLFRAQFSPETGTKALPFSMSLLGNHSPLMTNPIRAIGSVNRLKFEPSGL